LASTIRDVAARSGVSLGTISKYLNGGVVKKKTLGKIEEAIKNLDYKPNTIAKGLRNSRTFTVGVVLAMLADNFDSAIISSLEESLLPFGYKVIISDCHSNEEMEIEKIKFLLSHMVDGIVIHPYSMSGKQIEVIKESKTPFVVIDQTVPGCMTDSIVLDNEKAIEEPVEALIKMGHRDIAIIRGNMAYYSARGRFTGYEKAMNRHRIPIKEKYVRNGGLTIDGAYNAALDLFRLKKPPSALVVCNYFMTIGAVLAANFLHITIPDDISFIGFDDSPIINVVTPPLSIVSQPTVEMGRSAARLLIKRIKGDYVDYPEIIMHKATMRLTESVKAPQKKPRSRGNAAAVSILR